MLALAGKTVEQARPTDKDVPHLRASLGPSSALGSHGHKVSCGMSVSVIQYIYIFLVIIGCVLSHHESITHSQKNDHQPVPTDTRAHLGCVRAFRFTWRLGSPKVCLSFIFGW